MILEKISTIIEIYVLFWIKYILLLILAIIRNKIHNT